MLQVVLIQWKKIPRDEPLIEKILGPYTQEKIITAEALPQSVAGPACNPNSASPVLAIFVMGGLISTGITLTHTCPLDNWLMIFQVLTKLNKVELEDLPESGHTIGTALTLTNDGLYADSKLLILQSLPQHQEGKFVVRAIIFFMTVNSISYNKGIVFFMSLNSCPLL